MKETPHRYGRKYSTEEIKLLMQMWEADASPLAIAEALGTTAKAIAKMVTRLRLDGVPLKRRTRGHRAGEVAGQTMAGRRYQPWTQQEVEYLFRRRLASTATTEEIAADLDRSVHSVHGMIAKLRKEGAPIAMRGQGVRRLYDIHALCEASAGRFDDGEVALAADIPN